MILPYGNFLRGGKRMADQKFSRRDILKIGTAGALGLAGSMYNNDRHHNKGSCGKSSNKS